MANVKIGDLPATSSLNPTDVLPVVDVGGDATYKITVQNLANSLTQVSSSISSSYASNGGVTSIVAGTGISINASTGNVTITNTGGGGGGSPGGSNTQIQYNNSTAFGGVPTATYDGTTFRATGSFSGSFKGSLTGTSSLSQVTEKIYPSQIAGLTVPVALLSNTTGDVFAGYASNNLFFYNTTTQVISATASFATTSSFVVSSSYSATASLVTSASYATTASYTISASFAQTASSVNPLVQNVFITGSLIVSGANGAGVFSQGASYIDASGITTNGSYTIWRAPFSCSVVGLYGYQESGTTTKINAAKSSSAGYQLHSATDVTLTNEGGWYAASTLQNQNYNTGDWLKIVVTGSNATLVTVQVDFIRKI